MRFLLYLLVMNSMQVKLDPALGLIALGFLAWDVYETLKPGLKIVTMKNPNPQHDGSPVASHLASLLEQRKHCAQANNCADCQKFLEQFQALMVPEGQDPTANFKKATITGGPEPVKNGHGHGGGGYL